MITSQDITSALLQSVPIERDVYIKPPTERRITGMMWKLNKMVYGLVDASRGFYLNLSGELTRRGCIKSTMDPAMFIYFDEDKDLKEPEGVAVTHVDDVLSAGGKKFETDIMKKIKKILKVWK